MSDKPDAETACRAAIRHWSSLHDLATYAAEGHGYHNSDGGFGVTYPGDLDEYARYAEGQFIPPGYVVVGGFRGPPDGYEMFVTEGEYLSILARVLAEHGLNAEASQVRALAG